MGDVISLRQYTPAYGQVSGTSAAVPAYRPGPAYRQSPAHPAGRKLAPAGPRVAAPAQGPSRAYGTHRAYEPQGARSVADRLGLEGLRLTRRGRVVLVLLAMLLLAPMVTWGATAVASAPGEPTEVRVHAVQPGETLWGFAQEVARPGEDVRHAVARLQDLNEMTSGSVRVGELLLLPKE